MKPNLYEPFGPLKTLVLGNGLTETRTFDQRYAPSDIRVDGTSPVLDWSYATDFVGNITAITDLLNATNNRSRPQELPIDPPTAYFLAMLRAGNPEHEQSY